MVTKLVHTVFRGQTECKSSTVRAHLNIDDNPIRFVESTARWYRFHRLQKPIEADTNKKFSSKCTPIEPR